MKVVGDYLESGDRSKLHRQMQILYGDKNTVQTWFYSLYTSFAEESNEEEQPLQSIGSASSEAASHEALRKERLEYITKLFTLQYGSALTWSSEVLEDYRRRLLQSTRAPPTASLSSAASRAPPSSRAPPASSSGQISKEEIKAQLLEIARSVKERLGDDWLWRSIEIGRKRPFFTSLAAANATEQANTFQQYTTLKEKVRRQYFKYDSDKFPASEVRLDANGNFPEGSVGKELLARGMENAARQELFDHSAIHTSEKDRLLSDRVREMLKECIKQLGVKGDCNKIDRPIFFYFTGLLLDAGSRYQLAPLSGFKYNYVGFSVRDLHNYLLKECPGYNQLNNSLQRPFGQNLPDDEIGRNRYFQEFWLDTASPKNKFLK